MSKIVPVEDHWQIHTLNSDYDGHLIEKPTFSDLGSTTVNSIAHTQLTRDRIFEDNIIPNWLDLYNCSDGVVYDPVFGAHSGIYFVRMGGYLGSMSSGLNPNFLYPPTKAAPSSNVSYITATKLTDQGQYCIIGSVRDDERIELQYHMSGPVTKFVGILTCSRPVSSVAIGSQTVYCIDKLWRQLWEAPISPQIVFNPPKTASMTLCTAFAGMRIQQISASLNAVVLTEDGNTWLIGPQFSHLPCPFMVNWMDQDDLPTCVSMGSMVILFASTSGKIYRLYLNRYHEPPVLIAEPPEGTKFDKVCVHEEEVCTAITKQGHLYIWQEFPGVPLEAKQLPISMMIDVTKPTLVRTPWPVQQVQASDKRIFITSVPKTGSNQVYADFLNSNALPSTIEQTTTAPLPTKVEQHPYNMDSFMPYGSDAQLRSSQQAQQNLDQVQQPESSYQVEPPKSSHQVEQSESSYEADRAASSIVAQSSISRNDASSLYEVPRDVEVQQEPRSEPIVLPNEDQGFESELYKWNSRLQKIYCMSTDTEIQKNQQNDAFCKIYQDFLQEVVPIAKKIIEEMHLPNDEQTYQPIPQIGGLAGGQKYIVNGEMFFKLCIDNHNLYGGNEWSSKVGNLELHGMEAYASCIPKLHRDYKLRLPLLACIDYLGYRVTASSLCPITKLTIVYGSNDAGQTVHNDDMIAAACMEECAKILNLALHDVRNCESQLATAADVEVHRGFDGNLYLLDTARVFPPTVPGGPMCLELGPYSKSGTITSINLSREQAKTIIEGKSSIPISEGILYFQKNSSLTDSESASSSKDNENDFINPIATALTGSVIRGKAWFFRNQDGQRLFQQFRPEFVISNPKPLSSDALSAFATNSERQDQEVNRASNRLDNDLMLSLKSHFRSGSAVLPSNFLPIPYTEQSTYYQHNEEVYTPIIYSPSTLIRFTKSVGINIRKLGVFRLVTSGPYRAYAMAEMVFRASKNFIKRRLRTAVSLFHNLSSSKNSAQVSGLEFSADCLALPDPDLYTSKPLEFYLKAVTIQAFNLIFGSNSSSFFYWTQVIKVHLAIKFGVDCISEEERNRSYPLNRLVSMSYLFQALSRACGIEWNNETDRLMQTSTWLTTSRKFEEDQIVGFQSSTRTLKMGSLDTIKRSTYESIFDQHYFEDESDILDERKNDSLGYLEHIYDTRFSDVNFLEPSDFAPSREDPLVHYHLLENNSGPRRAFAETSSSLFNPSFNLELDKIYEIDSSTIANDIENQSSQNNDHIKQDGLDIIHSKFVSFYEEWLERNQQTQNPSPAFALDRIRLLICKTRPILDRRCSNADDFKTVLEMLETIAEELRQIETCNVEVLANYLYMKGQYYHLQSDFPKAEEMYFMALNILSLPAHVTPYFAEPKTKFLADREFTSEMNLGLFTHIHMHPMGMLIINHLLAMSLQQLGTIGPYELISNIFILLWNSYPFFGDSTARQRIFSGYAIPIAFTLDENYKYLTRPPEIIRSKHPLESPICQHWLKAVLDLEDNTNFQISTHWVDAPVSTLPMHLRPQTYVGYMKSCSDELPLKMKLSRVRPRNFQLRLSFTDESVSWQWLINQPDTSNLELALLDDGTIAINPCCLLHPELSPESPVSQQTQLLFLVQTGSMSSKNNDLLDEISSDPQKVFPGSNQVWEKLRLHQTTNTLIPKREEELIYVVDPEKLSSFDRSTLNINFCHWENEFSLRFSIFNVVNFLDPNQPAPKYFLCRQIQPFHQSAIFALPKMFDDAKPLYLDGYELFLQPSLSKFVNTDKRPFSFIFVKSDGTLAISSQTHFRGPSGWYLDHLRALDLSGECVVSVRCSKEPRLQGCFGYACLTKTGHIYVWGTNRGGIFANGREDTAAQMDTSLGAKLIFQLNQPMIDLDFGERFLVALSKKGEVFFWGTIGPTSITVGDRIDQGLHAIRPRHEYKKHENLSNFLPTAFPLPLWGGEIPQTAVAIAAGAYHMIAISNYGIPYLMGDCQVDGTPFLYSTWVRVFCRERIVSVACGTMHTIMLSENGNVYCFGDNSYRQCGVGDPSNIDGIKNCLKPLNFFPMKPIKTVDIKFTQVVASFIYSAACTESGDVWIWGNGANPYKLQTDTPIRFIQMTRLGHILMGVDPVNNIIRTLPLASIQQQIRAILQILQTELKARSQAQPLPIEPVEPDENNISVGVRAPQKSATQAFYEALMPTRPSVPNASSSEVSQTPNLQDQSTISVQNIQFGNILINMVKETIDQALEPIKERLDKMDKRLQQLENWKTSKTNERQNQR